MDVLEEISLIISRTMSVYKLFNMEWLKYLQANKFYDFIDENGKMKISLKQHCVSEIKENPILFNLIEEYRNFAVDNPLYLSILGVRYRIKLANSVQSKIETYIKKKSENGKVPIIKCLNDICGIRIEIDDNYTFEQIENFIKSKFGNKLKVLNVKRGEYTAIHVYFREGNYFFPMEMQIWYKKDHDKNDISHHKFKQSYISWENEIKNNSIVKKEETW